MFLNFSSASQSILLLFKIGFLLVVVIYLCYLLIVLKQIRAMNRVVNQPQLFPFLQTGAFILILLSLVLFFVSLVIL